MLINLKKFILLMQKNLVIIKINDLNILNEIYTKYPNKKYSNAIYKELIKNSIIEE